MMHPAPAPSMCGTTARTMLSMVCTLMSNMAFQSSSLVSCTGGPIRKPPAMLQSTSIRPKRAMAAVTTASISLRSSRFAGAMSRRGSSPPNAATSGSRRDATSTRLSPRSEKACATARPRLPEAPVTTTVSGCVVMDDYGSAMLGSLDHAAADLVALERLEQGLEIAFAEPLVALALDEFEEHGPEQRLREDLEQQARLAALRRPVE